QNGTVRYTVRGKFSNKPSVECLLFDNAAELRTSLVRYRVEGIYMGTDYSFVRTDANRRVLLKLAASFYSSKDTPRAASLYYFGLAAEAAWNQHRMARADAELAEHGALRFNVGKNKGVVVGPGFIEFHFNGRVDRCDAADIRSIDLDYGLFTIRHRD